MNRSPAIVIKLDSLTGLDIARILRSYKVPVIGIADDPAHFSCKTNACMEIHYTNTSDGNLLRTLMSLAPKWKSRCVLVPCSDESVRVISDNRAELGEFYNFVIPDGVLLDLYMNKVNFYKYAQQNGFPIPATFYPVNKSDLKEISDRNLFPYIIKPVKRTENWLRRFNKKVVEVTDSEHLSRVFDMCSAAGEDVIVQEWIDGRDSDLYSCIFYYDKDCNRAVTFTSRKLRQWHIENGDACLAEECRNDEVLNITMDLLSRVRFKGIGSVEFKLDSATGGYFIIEPNIGRPVSRISLVEAAGVPIIYTMYCDASGLPLPSNRGQRYAGVKWIALYLDLRSAWAYFSEGKLTLRDWLKSLSGLKSCADFSMRDPLPFMAILYIGFFVLLKKIWYALAGSSGG